MDRTARSSQIEIQHEGLKITRVNIIINGVKREVQCDLDSGSKLLFWGIRDFKRAKMAGVEPIKLRYPVRIRVANNKFEYARACVVLELQIPVLPKPVTIKNAVVYLVDGPWDDFLIGWPVLHALGITPEQNIARCAGNVVNMAKYDQELIGVTPEELGVVQAAQALSSKVESLIEAHSRVAITTKEVETKLDELEDTWKVYRVSEGLEEPIEIGISESNTLNVQRCAKGVPSETTKGGRKYGEGPIEIFPQSYEPEEFEESGLLEMPEEENTFEELVQKQLQASKRQGITKSARERLRKILNKYEKVFATKFSECQISNLTPMEPRLKEGAQPCFAKPRRMSIEQLKWLRKHIQQMVELGMLVRVENPIWGIPVFVVEKPGKPGEWRMVADFRAVNARSERTSLPMPLLEQMLEATSGAKYYGSLDNMKGFNLLGTTRSDIFTLVTPFGCYEMKVAPMGYLNSPPTYQDRIVNEVLDGIHLKTCCNWIDDLLVFARNEDEYLDRLEQILQRYEKYKVKQNLRKCELFRTKVVWCGREFYNGTYTFASKYYDKVLETPEPEYAVDLMSFLFSIQWLSISLDPLGILEAKGPLIEIIDRIYQVKNPKGSRKKKLLVGVKLKDFGWGIRESEAFKKCLQIIQKAIRLAIVDERKVMCLFTDASASEGCAIIITQCSPEELEKPVEEQRHELIFLTTHKWTKQEIRWHISSQECYPIIFAINRFDYIFAGRHVRIFMDHKNLKYILEPDKTTSKTTLMRLSRWALLIQSQRYTIYDIAGKENVAADLWSRWGVSQAREVKAKVGKVPRMVRNLEAYNQLSEKAKEKQDNRRQVVPGNEKQVARRKNNTVKVNMPKELDRNTNPHRTKFLKIISRTDSLMDIEGNPVEVPSIEEIKKVQRDTIEPIPPNGERKPDGLVCVKGKPWIPVELVPIVVAISHQSLGHPGANALEESISKEYYSKRFREYAKDLNSYCLVCMGEHLPKLIRRKLGEQIYATKRCEVLHLDFVVIKDSEYVLMISDDLTSKRELFHAERADAVTAAQAVMWWRARYGIAKGATLVTDGGSHFANSLLKELANQLRIFRHITVAYSPWANGKAERPNKELLKLLRILRKDMKLSKKSHWSVLLPDVQYKLNNTPKKRLKGRTPDEVFLLNEDTGPMKFIAIDQEENEVKAIPINYSKPAEHIMKELGDRLDRWHNEIIEVQHLERLKNLAQQYSARVKQAQFAIGDWVLVSRGMQKQHKLMRQWIGPFQVVDTKSPWVYKVRNLVKGKEYWVHSCRLRFYEHKWLLKFEDIKDFVIFSTEGYDVENIWDHRWNSRKKEYQVQVTWIGMEDSDKSYISLESAVLQAPKIVDHYLNAEWPEEEKLIPKMRAKREKM